MTRPEKNLLTGHPGAADELYRAAGARDFDGGQLEGDMEMRADGATLASPRTGGYARRRLRGTYTSPVIEAEFPFNEVLPSWNIRLDEKRQSYTVHFRAEDERGWSPWFYFGRGGLPARSDDSTKVVKAAGHGRVKIDYLILDRPATRFQYRVELESPARAAAVERIGAPVLSRFFVAYSNTTGDEGMTASRKAAAGKATGADSQVLAIPFRDQRAVPHRKLGREICCPTCVAMILESHGIDLSTLTVAGQAWCGERRIYGVWPRASQAASQHGMEAWVQRFRSAEDVKELIAAGTPVMASIRVKEGELSNSRYRKTPGHLILIRGYTPEGYVVNDPYSPGPDGAEIVYSEEDMAKVWFDKGGVGIVIRRPSDAENGR